MGKVILRIGDVKTMKNFGKAHSEIRRCKNDENIMEKFILRRGYVKTVKILWESSI